MKQSSTTTAFLSQFHADKGRRQPYANESVCRSLLPFLDGYRRIGSLGNSRLLVSTFRRPHLPQSTPCRHNFLTGPLSAPRTFPESSTLARGKPRSKQRFLPTNPCSPSCPLSSWPPIHITPEHILVIFFGHIVIPASIDLHSAHRQHPPIPFPDISYRQHAHRSHGAHSGSDHADEGDQQK